MICSKDINREAYLTDIILTVFAYKTTILNTHIVQLLYSTILNISMQYDQKIFKVLIHDKKVRFWLFRIGRLQIDFHDGKCFIEFKSSITVFKIWLNV